MGVLIGELNELLADGGDGSAAGVAPRLSPPSRAVFEMFPAALQAELLQERDPHGNVQVDFLSVPMRLSRGSVHAWMLQKRDPHG